MKIFTGKADSLLQEQSGSGLFAQNMGQMPSPELEYLSRNGNTDPDMIKRAMEREDEERDLRVLDAYNRFEAGLQEILTGKDSGVMVREGGAAQSAVFEVSDYFNEQGSRLRDELPDEKCRERFMDILSSRRRTAINAVARFQSQEYQKWKDSTAALTIDSILKAVNISPDAASLMHGEQLLEGTIMRLYRSSNPELLTVKLNNARQAMYSGALESIAAKDPVTAVIVLESWKDHLGDDIYLQLRERFAPLARNQSLKMEFMSLRDLEGEILKAELEDINDEQMREELAEMIIADRMLKKVTEERAEKERINSISRELFQLYNQGQLSAEDIVDSGLSPDERSRWRMIFSSDGTGDDQTLLRVVQEVADGSIQEEHQIYRAIAEGLGKLDVLLLATLFSLKDNPEAKLMINGLQEISEVSAEYGGDEQDHAAAIRDFLNRIVALVGKGEPFRITAVRNEVIKDHFGTQKSNVRDSKTASATEGTDPANPVAEIADHYTPGPDVQENSEEDESIKTD
ncbi:hypothetical protein [Maridesulfovibrio sp. FT414]|uniref:hypothetical protein n=1 Tax=Maridesulfovibrio sp. FT414 TaxID=2979469 RepID=UPI003D8029C3